MAFKNPKNLKQISEDPAKEQILNEVIRICNKLAMEMMEEGIIDIKFLIFYMVYYKKLAVQNPSIYSSLQEIFELVESLRNLNETHDIKLINLEISFFNNYSVFFTM